MLEENPFWEGGGLVRNEVKWKIVYFSEHPFFYSSISSNHPSGKSVVRHEI